MSRSTVAKWVAVGSIVTLAGCNLKGKNDQVSRYLFEIKNGVERVFPEEAASGKRNDSALKEHFVSPQGSASSDGTSARPWDLRTALSHPKAIKPGDVVWLRGGVYRGVFTSDLIGRSSLPIVVRQYPGERAKIDGCVNPPSTASTLTIKGEYTWYWGFEVAGCPGRRAASVANPASGPASSPASGVTLSGTDLKLINLVIHDSPGGIHAESSAKRAEMSGNVIYFNGWDGSDHGYGDGISVQNEMGMKSINQNIVFNQFGSGIHAYSHTGFVNNLILDGNLMFSNGALSERPALSRNLLIGGQHPAVRLTLSGNTTYAPVAGGGANILGYGAGCSGVVLTDNYFAGPDALTLNECKDIDIRGNAFVGATGGFQPFLFRENEYRAKPSVTAIELRVNQWEAGRGYLAVFNWENKGRVVVDVARLGWKVGQKYRLRNVQNYFDDSMTGVYDGESIDVPMTGWKVATPVGRPAPKSTFPEFGAFLIETDDYPVQPNKSDGVQVSATSQ